MLAAPPLPPAVERLGPKLRQFCAERADCIERLEIFGSVARGDAGPHSDVDLLVTFRPNAVPQGLAYFSFAEDMREDLAALLGRSVDLVDRAALRAGSLEKAVQRDARLVYDRNRPA